MKLIVKPLIQNKMDIQTARTASELLQYLDSWKTFVENLPEDDLSKLGSTASCYVPYDHRKELIDVVKRFAKGKVARIEKHIKALK